MPIPRVGIGTRRRPAVLARSYSDAIDLWKGRRAITDGPDLPMVRNSQIFRMGS